MSQIPYELIREVQISTRAAAALPDYDPSDPTLPALPPLSAAIAASDASPPHRRCSNCKALLLRGTESIICLYCGVGPHYDVVPDPICFTSTIGYQWLLRSLRLDGSELVDQNNKHQRDHGQSSPRASTRLSEFLNFKVTWQAETENQETSFPDEHSEESKRSLRLTGVAPDRFFLKPKRDYDSDVPIEQPSEHNQIETAGRKDSAALDDQDLFQNVRSSKPAVSFEHKTNEYFSEWEADFQSADSENQHGSHRPSKHIAGSSAESGIKFQDPESFQNSSAQEVDLSAHFDSSGGYRSSEHVAGSAAESGIKFQDPESFQSSPAQEADLSAHFDSLFGPGANLNDGKPKDGPVVSPAFDDWNSDDMWNNLSSREPNSTGGFDATFSVKNDPQNDRIVEYSKDNSTTDDLFQGFQTQTNYTDMTNSKTTKEDSYDMWNNLSSREPSSAGGFDATFSVKNDPQNDRIVEYSKDKPTTDDLFQDFQTQTNYADMANSKTTKEEHRTMDGDLFEEWNDFTGSASLQVPSQNAWPGANDKVFTSKEKSTEGDLFSFDNKCEGGDFGSFSESNFFSTSTSNSNAPAEVNAIMSEDPASNWFTDASSPSHETGQADKNEDASGKSSQDDVKMLMSQMHDLSFMLESGLSIPSGSDAPSSSPKG